MLSLYNLYKEIILERINRPDILSTLGNKQVVTIYYRGDHTINAGYRDIEVYALGLSKAGNPVIRAWQLRGKTDTEIPAWKLFRIDKISSWKPKKGEFFRKPISDRKPGIPKFNPVGDKSMIKVDKIVNFKK